MSGEERDPEPAYVRRPNDHGDMTREEHLSQEEAAVRERGEHWVRPERDGDSRPPISFLGAPMSEPAGFAKEEDKQPVKRSWRRKYRKMRVKFEDTMVQSNDLIKGEHKAMAIARRLQEQNDQILDLLLDINESTHIPGFLRYDLRSPSPSESAVPSLEADTDDPIAIESTIREARADLIAGRLSAEDFAQLESKLYSSRTLINNPRLLSTLIAKTPHTVQAPEILPEGIILGEHAPGYLDPLHEEEYLLAADAALSDPTAYDPNAHDGRPLPIPRHAVPNEKDLTIQNPDSVYNWLRKHQPQVFLQDKDPGHPENLSEKSSAHAGKASGRGGKRQSVAPGPKTEQDVLDDEIGFVPESGTASAKRGRNKQDDEPYRPKGGSTRPGKRKREDGEEKGKGGRKKGRVSGGAASTVGN